MGKSHKNYNFFPNFSLSRITLFYLALSRFLTGVKSFDTEQVPIVPDLQDPCTYLPAIYDDETINYLAPRKITFYTNEMVETIINAKPNSFMSEYMYQIMPDLPSSFFPKPDIFPLLSVKYFDSASEVLPIYGFSGSETDKVTLGYMAKLNSGYLLALGASYKPVIRIKIDTSMLFKLFGEDENDVQKGEEIYYSYVNPETLTLMNVPMGEKFENKVDYLDWSIETLKPSLEKKGNLIQQSASSKKIDITEWFHKTGEPSKLYPLSFFSVLNACKEKDLPKKESQQFKRALV